MNEVNTTLAMIRKIRSMAKILIPVISDDPILDRPSEMYLLLRNDLRKNFMRLQSVVTLCRMEKMGDSALEIARNMAEDVLSINYILSHDDREARVHQFFEFRWIQAKQDYDYYSKLKASNINVELPPKDIIDKEYARVKKEFKAFTKKDKSEATSWTNRGPDGMADFIATNGIYSPEEIDNIKRSYQLGSRKTHFNPYDLLNYSNQHAWDKTSLNATRVAILLASASIISITLRYYDVIKHYNYTYTDKGVLAKMQRKQKEIQALDT